MSETTQLETLEDFREASLSLAKDAEAGSAVITGIATATSRKELSNVLRGLLRSGNIHSPSCKDQINELLGRIDQDCPH